MTEQPLLALVMITKDEAAAIRDTLLSVKPIIDRYAVLDMGSTDGTQDTVREVLEGVPGELAEEVFSDFSTARNQALDRLGTQAVFTLMLDAGERLVEPEALRRFCEEHREATGHSQGAYYLRIHEKPYAYDAARLARTEAGWRYVGFAHEVLIRPKTPPPSVRIPGVHSERAPRDHHANRPRWELDLRLLTEESKRRPNDAHVLFALAQTLEALQEHRRAFGLYERRAKMDGWQEEVYESLFRIARIAQRSGGRPWPEVQQLYLNAHTHSPQRAEPLFAIAWHWYEQKNHPLTYLFAARGAALPYPEKANLWVDEEVYQYKLLDLVGTAAYYLGEYEAGEAALRKALERRPEDPRFLKNLSFYRQGRSL